MKFKVKKAFQFYKFRSIFPFHFSSNKSVLFMKFYKDICKGENILMFKDKSFNFYFVM